MEEERRGTREESSCFGELSAEKGLAGLLLAASREQFQSVVKADFERVEPARSTHLHIMVVKADSEYIGSSQLDHDTCTPLSRSRQAGLSERRQSCRERIGLTPTGLPQLSTPPSAPPRQSSPLTRWVWLGKKPVKSPSPTASASQNTPFPYC